MFKPHGAALGSFLLGWAALAAAQDVSVEQNKLLARRSAEADAYRKLAEAVYGLQINSRTYVRDFVTESDDIRSEVDTFIKGVRLGTPTWYEDGSCEVPAEVTVAKVIETLRTAHDRYYKGEDIKTADFESMASRIEKKVIKVVGNGAPRPDLPPDLPSGVAEILGPAPPAPGRPPIPEIWLSLGPQSAQARLMALRAARLDAIRRLAERIKGLRLTSRTFVRDFVPESDEIRTELDTRLASAGEEVSSYLHHDELIAEVTMRLSTEQVITTIKELHSRRYTDDPDDLRGHDIVDIVKTVVKKDFEATGYGIPPPQYLRRYNEVAAMPVPDWAMGQIEATGAGTDPEINTPQGRLRAARAAELDAKRKLAEQIAGLRIESSTTVRDFVTEHDNLQVLVDAILLDARVTRTSFTDGEAQVTVSVPGMRVWDVLNDELGRRSKRPASQ